MDYSPNRTRQHGTALLISMIILLVMTMIILQGARSANLELLVGSNSQYAAEALVQAEDGAIAGETFVEVTYTGAPVMNYGEADDDGVFLDGQVDVDSLNWEQLSPELQTRSHGSLEYIVEYVGPSYASGGSLSLGAGASSDTRYIYRVSGRGESDRGGARVVQTVYATAE
jgi:hypothetical protein